MSKAKERGFVPFKFRSLQCYASTEWLGDSKKKYQKVFCNEDISYLYAELSFFNKLFDEEEWECKIRYTCHLQNGKSQTEICDFSLDRKVKKDENIVFVREGWGNATKGNFWKPGSYVWKAYVDETLLGMTEIFIEDLPFKQGQENPYFNLDSVKLFEGPDPAPIKGQRTYYTTFDSKTTRYIWAEIELTNKLGREWPGELFVNFFNDAGQFKGGINEFFLMKGDNKTLSVGWGVNNPGSWFEDGYRLELVFLDQLIAAVPFVVSNHNEEGLISPLVGDNVAKLQKKPEDNQINHQNLEHLLAEMDELIGMENIKQKIKDYVKYLNFLTIRKEKGFDDSSGISLHAVLTGNPGTGKTTIAKKLGKIYKEMGLLTKGHVHEVDRADLVAEFIGQTAPKTKKAIEQSRGGILFIDEAYSLHRGDNDKDYGKEVIEILLKEMSDGAGDLAVIVAGYPQEMNSFLNSNPGLKSRFNHYFQFEDYIPEELIRIADLAIKNRKLEIVPEAREFLFTQFTKAFRDRDRTFGNARFAMSVIDEAKMNMGLRLMQMPNVNELSDAEISTILPEDVFKIFSVGISKQLNLQIDEKLLKEALNELNELIGLQKLKEEVIELVKLVKYYKEIGKDVLNKFVLHSVFIGNPGTGKTTVARIFSKIFRALGILEKGHLIECDREALVAGYSGQTAIKTADIVEKALGGVLFIDEAYSLHQGNQDAFGMEAINTLLKRMEDNRDDFVVIAAGYPDNMREFLSTNPGLKSRFEQVFIFEDYSPEELLQIGLKIIENDGLKASPEAIEHLRNVIRSSWEKRDKFFGNAREIRKMMQESIRKQHLRMAEIHSSQRTLEMITSLTFDDVKEFKVITTGKGETIEKPLGFRIRKE